jgi:hypothetical protein
MKKAHNINIALEIVDNLLSKEVFKDVESEDAATEIILRVLNGFEELNPKKKKSKKLKDKTVEIVDKMQFLSNEMFDNLRDFLNKKDEDEK